MRLIGSRIAAAGVAAAILFDSTAAVAQNAPAATPQTAQTSWMTLSMLSTSGAVGLAGAAAQPAADQPPPPPPPPGALPPPDDRDNRVGGVPLPVIGIWLAEIALAVYILTKHHHGEFNFPNSPA